MVRTGKTRQSLGKLALAVLLGAALVSTQSLPALAVTGQLANTGGDAQWGLIVTGIVIIVLGGGVLWWGARRRKNKE